MDRWGDSTHKMSAYNNRYHPSNRDQRQIDRMERETMVLYPTLQPNPVLPKRSPGFSGGRGMFRGLNWRAEGLRFQLSRNELESEREEGPSTSSFYKQQREAAPFVTRRRFHRKSPSRRPHRRTPYYPPSPQYRDDSTSEDETVQVPAASTRGIQSRFIGFLGEIHFVQTFCQLAQHHADVRRAFILYFLEQTYIQFCC